MVYGVGTTHHVLLDGHYFLVRPGSYQKKPAPQFGARFTTGDPDFNNLGIWQHWAQRCWVGGVDAEVYADDAMFDDGIGVDSTWHEKMTLARGMFRGGGANWGIGAGTVHGAEGNRFIVYNSQLYVYTWPSAGNLGYLFRWNASTDAWDRITALDAVSIVGRCLEVFDGKLFIGGYDLSGNPKVVYDDGALTSWSTLANPSGIGAADDVHAMKVFQQKLYIAYGVKIWRSKNDQTWDGNTEFYRASDNGGNWIAAMETHLGFLYMLSNNGHIHRTDGNTSFDLWNWDGQTYGIAIRSFDGRLFVLTYEYTETTNVGFGCLYQMSGSAVTQLKRWGQETYANRIGNMTVFDRRLFYGASNGLGMGNNHPVFGVACYDPIEDAHSIIAACSDATTYVPGTGIQENWIVDDQIFFSGRLFVAVRGHGAFYTVYKHHDYEWGQRRYDISNKGASLDSLNGGWFTSSTYDAGTPGVDKLWRRITVDVDLPSAATGIVVDYSTNGGQTWTKVGALAGVKARGKYSFYLSNVKGTSFKLRVTLRSTDTTKTPRLYGYFVSYLPIPDPNWMWSFTIVLSEHQQLLDGTETTVNTEAELDYLNTAYRTKSLLHFTDAEGYEWAKAGGLGVMIYDMTVALRDLNQPLEGEVTLTLLEAVEDYV